MKIYAAAMTLAILVFGLMAPALAKQPKTTICHPVASATGGNTHAGYSIITTANPSSHIDEETGAPKHEHDGRVDFVVDEAHPCPPQGEEPTDVCPNIPGDQAEVPDGFLIDPATGDCVEQPKSEEPPVVNPPGNVPGSPGGPVVSGGNPPKPINPFSVNTGFSDAVPFIIALLGMSALAGLFFWLARKAQD